jgi:hypothetical protein
LLSDRGSGSQSGSIPLTNGSGSRRSKNIRIRQIRIPTTAIHEKTLLRAEDQTLLYEETEAEVDSQRGKVEELVALGRELVKGTHYKGR